jgi:hypothetical protein
MLKSSTDTFRATSIGAAIWLFCFTLTIDSEAVTYRTLAARTVKVLISDITSINPSRLTPISRAPIGAYISLKDGSRVLVNLKVFPSEAATKLFHWRKNI